MAKEYEIKISYYDTKFIIDLMQEYINCSDKLIHVTRLLIK